MSDEYFCPNCGAILNEQSGFDPDGGHWKCTSCGMDLFDNDAAEGERFEGTYWICDKCGAVLSSQSGFSDYCDYWQCDSCGFVNRISASDILEDGEEWDQSRVPDDASGFWDLESKESSSYEDENSWLWSDDDSETSAEESRQKDPSYSEYESHSSDEMSRPLRDLAEDVMALAVAQAKYRREEERTRQWEASLKRRAFARSHWKLILVAVVVALLLAAGLYASHEYQKLRVVGMSSSELVGVPFNQAEEKIGDAGFTQVSSEEMFDLGFDELEAEGTVMEVSISGSTDFDASAMFPFNSEIVVRYHSAKLAYPPISGKAAKGMDYHEVVEQFEAAGFGNVKTEAHNDSLIGVLNKVDTVDSVTVDGDKRYSEEREYRIDAEVVVHYHARVF